MKVMKSKDAQKLLKLFDEFIFSSNRDGSSANTESEKQILRVVKTWIDWYQQEEAAAVPPYEGGLPRTLGMKRGG